MNNLQKKEFKRMLVRRLKNKGIIGGAHKPEDSFLRAYRRHPDRQAVLQDYKELIKEGVIVRQKKTGEPHVALNRDKRKYGKYLPKKK